MNKYVRIKEYDGIFWGRVHENEVILLDNAPWESPRDMGRKVKLEMGKLAAPVTPSKIVLIGKNYPEHIKEMSNLAGTPSEEPIIFMKPPTAVIGPNDSIPRYSQLDRVDYEGELAAVIGRKIFRGGSW